MKKIIFGLLLLLLTIYGIFYKQILATLDFYQYQSDHAEKFAQAKITWKPIPFTSTVNSGNADKALNFDSLLLPIPFTATITEGTDGAFALGANKSINVTHSSIATDFLTNDFSKSTESDHKMTCTFLTQTSNLGACSSNYNYYRAFLELNESDMHLFSTIEDKILYNKILTIRADTIPSNTASGFETSLVRGFLFSTDSSNYVAHLFDQNDQMFEVTFSNISQGNVAFVLSNTSSNQK